MTRIEARAAILRSLGASEGQTAELLAYNQPKFTRPLGPLADCCAEEMFAATWEDYAREAKAVGVWLTLRAKLVQLHFPIREGISLTDAYRAATRRGVPPETPPEATGLELVAPEQLELTVWPTPAGRMPILYMPHREDFVAILCALASRNEPATIPRSMGASIISGLNNWDRVARYRHEWVVRDPEHCREEAWKAEFSRLIGKKHLYQDRLILLSRGVYSDIAAPDMGLSLDDWLRFSLVIRREHECTHYCTLRLFGTMGNNLLDELIADYFGIVAARGHYRADWFLRFLGLEAYPDYRDGGRFENYRGQPPLSVGAMLILQALVVRAAHHLERVDRVLREGSTPLDSMRLLLMLASQTLEELASETAETLCREAYDAIMEDTSLTTPGCAIHRSSGG